MLYVCHRPPTGTPAAGPVRSLMLSCYSRGASGLWAFLSLCCNNQAPFALIGEASLRCDKAADRAGTGTALCGADLTCVS